MFCLEHSSGDLPHKMPRFSGISIAWSRSPPSFRGLTATLLFGAISPQPKEGKEQQEVTCWQRSNRTKMASEQQHNCQNRMYASSAWNLKRLTWHHLHLNTRHDVKTCTECTDALACMQHQSKQNLQMCQIYKHCDLTWLVTNYLTKHKRKPENWKPEIFCQLRRYAIVWSKDTNTALFNFLTCCRAALKRNLCNDWRLTAIFQWSSYQAIRLANGWLKSS